MSAGGLGRGWRLLRRYLRRAPVSLVACPPVAPEGEDWAAAVKLRDAVRAQILKHCGEPDLIPRGDGGGRT